MIEEASGPLAHSAVSLKPVAYDDSSRPQGPARAIIGALDQNSIVALGGHGLFILRKKASPALATT